MAHLNLHLAAGLVAGTAIAGIPLARAWLAGRPLARPIAAMIVLTCAVGVWAIVPNLLGKLGVHLGGPRWADVFVLHTTLDRRTDGGLLIGEVAIAATLVGQYLVTLAAVVRARRRSRSLVP